MRFSTNALKWFAVGLRQVVCRSPVASKRKSSQPHEMLQGVEQLEVRQVLAGSNLSAPYFTANAINSSEIDLNWKSVPGATSYQVRQWVNNSWQQIANLGGGATWFPVTGLKPDTFYMFDLVATNASGSTPALLFQFAVTKPAETVIQKVPTYPLFTATAVSDTAILLSWNTVAGADGYRINAWRNGDWSNRINWPQIAQLDGKSTSYTVTGLVPGTTYSFNVSAYNTAGSSGAEMQSATTKPGLTSPMRVPATPAFGPSVIGGTTINLSWTGVTGADGYRLSQWVNGAWSQVALLGNSTTGYAVDNLYPGTRYYFSLVAFNAAGLSSAAYQNHTTMQQRVPNAPSFTATVVSETEIGLSWGSVADADGYVIRQYINGAWQQIARLGGGSTSYGITGLNPGTSYKLTVDAFNTFGTSVSYGQRITTKPGQVPPIKYIRDLWGTLYDVSTGTSTVLETEVLAFEIRGDRLWAQRNDEGGTPTWEYVTGGQASAVMYDNILEIVGTGGNDQIMITSNSDQITVSLAGKISSFSYSSVNEIVVYGGVGNDQIDLTGLRGSTVATMLRGMSVFVVGGAGNDTISGGSGTNTLRGGSGNDTVYGGWSTDYLIGGSGDDQLYGGVGNDYLYGNAGNDGLFGGSAGDTDSLMGGSGADRFLKQSGDQVSDSSSEDAIMNFTSGSTGRNTGVAAWSDIEIIQVDQGLALLHARTKNTRLLKLSNGKELWFRRVTVLTSLYGGIAAADNDSEGNIQFADATFSRSYKLGDNSDAARVTIHEIGHNWDNYENKPYENGSFNSIWFHSQPGYVSDYARKSAAEDFAETFVTAFLLNPPGYNTANAPGKFHYMKNWLDTIMF